MFMPSDNNLVSGAFRSMATLNHILNNELGIETLIVLPNKTGNGYELLDSMNLKYTYIDSYNWIMGQQEQISKTFFRRLNEQKQLNEIAVDKLVELIKREHIDIVHINTSYSYVGAQAALKTGTPVVWHLREFLEEDQKRCFINRDTALKLISKSSKIITISQVLRQKYENIFLPDKLTTIYNGLDEKKFYQPDKSIFANENNYVFTSIGSVNRNKGQQILVEACGILFKKNRLKTFTINIVGNCNEHTKNYLISIAKKYNIEDKLNILGPHSDVVPFLKETDIFFMCSAFEAFGRVTVEAMMSGALVIGANTGATPEIIEDGVNGILYEQHSPKDLSDKILYAIQNKSLMQKIAKRGQNLAISKFTALSNAKEVAKVYKQVLNDYSTTDVYAVVVTYNRLEMLKQCIKALVTQSYESLKIIVVNNNSNDGTTEFLNTLDNPRIIHMHIDKNVGGAGGFNIGIQAAYSYNAKWVWVMDDDVIPAPDALKNLIDTTEYLKDDNISYLASCVYSPEGQAMNTPGIDTKSANGYPFWYEKLDKGLVKINTATFVSILINSDAIDMCGLPCANFFIWGDDTEYTKRLSKKFGDAYLVGNSKVLHNRHNACNLSIFNEDNINRISMYKYFIRNTLIYTREYGGEQAFLNKLSIYKKDCKRLRYSRDPYKKEKIKVIKEGINSYKHYDFKTFKHRNIMFYNEKSYMEEEKRKIYKQSSKSDLLNKIKKGVKYYRAHGLRATISRILRK